MLVWDGDTTLQKIDKKAGLISNVIEELTVNENGQIYVSSFSGVSILSPTERSHAGQSYEIRNYTEAHGLPSNEVFDIDYYGDTIYVATRNGLAKLQIVDTVQQVSKTPIIEKVTVNDSVFNVSSSLPLFKHFQNNLKINYKTIDHSALGNIEYRYKVNEEDWKETRETSLSFINLPPDRYNIEIQSKNIDGKWSPSCPLSIGIKKPWWKQMWFLVFFLFSFLWSVYYVYRRRIDSIRQESQIKEDVRDLERQALQAQMNPHFIFNCLNAIQNYIMSNNKTEAMEYLSMFARLIRQSLDASSQNKIALDLEIRMLKNYLELEKMRFKSRFEYKIEMPNYLDIDDIEIPPLLIQPFVENAVLYGMKPRKDGGLIVITFKKLEDYLKVQIIDNGSGIKEESLSSNRRSYGIGITQKRLAHINSYQGTEYDLDIKSSGDGTRVNITIKI